MRAVQAGIDSGQIPTSDTAVFGVSLDSPAANAAFAEQNGLEFPLLSDMNHKMLTTYGILKTYSVENEDYQWALRANIVIDKRSTRLNSSHGYISYAVFCLKKKTN